MSVWAEKLSSGTLKTDMTSALTSYECKEMIAQDWLILKAVPLAMPV
jgi:hypothetical protein